ELLNYAQRALVKPLITYPPGRNLADTWVRDIGAAALLDMTRARFQVPLSVNRASKKKRLSACYLVSVALGQRGHNLGERRLEKIHSEHSTLAQRLSASLLPI